MKPELSWDYLHTIESDPLSRLISMNEDAWVETYKQKVKAALKSDLIGIPLYDAWPSSWPIPENVWQARLTANWARLMEYDRLTEARQKRA